MKTNKKRIFTVVLIFSILSLAACGGMSKWVGAFGGTASGGSKVEIIVNEDGSVSYNDDGEIFEGEWTENENSINLDFGGELSSRSEPLIVTLSSDEQSIVVESMNTHWKPDTYQRR